MYDVMVIGGGPGGYAAAIRVSQLGGKVALCEADELGGTCVNRGCIPSKVWSRAAYMMDMIRRAQSFGLKAQMAELDLNTLVELGNGVATDIKMGMKSLLGKSGIDVITGKAKIVAPGKVNIKGKVLDAKVLIIATGSFIAPADLPGSADIVITSDEVLKFKKLPGSAIVWGGGPIEIEMASWLNAFGVEVTLACQDRRILPDEDSDTSQRLASALRERGVKIFTRVTIEHLKKETETCNVIFGGEHQQSLVVASVIAASRKPNTSGLGLEDVGVALAPDGSIIVNEYLETNVASIFAIGDATGGRMLSHRASAMAIISAENAMGGKNRFEERYVCRGLWTIPQVAAVGLTEAEAEEKGYDVETGDFPYAINGLAMAYGEVAGNVKVVLDSRYGEILGVHIVGACATEVIGQAALTMQMECTADELAKGIRLHPTFSESMVDAAREAMGWALYLPKR
jgi:dihydrolipoamide dehydrogenase